MTSFTTQFVYLYELDVPAITGVPVIISECFVCSKIYIQSSRLTITGTLATAETSNLYFTTSNPSPEDLDSIVTLHYKNIIKKT